MKSRVIKLQYITLKFRSEWSYPFIDHGVSYSMNEEYTHGAKRVRILIYIFVYYFCGNAALVNSWDYSKANLGILKCQLYK